MTGWRRPTSDNNNDGQRRPISGSGFINTVGRRILRLEAELEAPALLVLVAALDAAVARAAARARVHCEEPADAAEASRRSRRRPCSHGNVRRRCVSGSSRGVVLAVLFKHELRQVLDPPLLRFAVIITTAATHSRTLTLATRHKRTVIEPHSRLWSRLAVLARLLVLRC